MKKLPRFILAADHRLPFRPFEKPRVERFKTFLVQALVKARVPDAGLLLDPEFGEPAIAAARKAGIPCGQPLEDTGVVPLRFLPGGAEALAARAPDFAKVLIRGPEHLDHAAKLVDAAYPALDRAGLPLVAELIFDKDHVEHSIDWIRRWPGRAPTHWKLYGHGDPDVLGRLIAAAPEGSRFWVLGGGESLDLLESWFKAARGFAAFAGFAVGRTIFWGAFEKWLAGQIDDAAAVAEISERYLAVRQRWS